MLNPGPNRIPGLDGLRAISIILVLILHLGIPYYIIPGEYFGYTSIGHLGVMVFFVISGYLITSILLRELDGDGRIHLARFYFRRTLRIFPPYYFLVLFYIVIQAAGWIQLAPRDVAHMLTYTSNYYPGRVWEASHFWSLAVEEQFYLLWPATLALLGKRRGLWAAVLLILLCPLLRVGIYHFFPLMYSDIRYRTETAADSIAVGCLLAGKYELLKAHPLAGKLHGYYQKFLDSKLFVLAPVVVLAAGANSGRPRVHLLVGFTIINLGIAACVDWCVTRKSGRVAQILNSAPLVFIGVMSYSIYLWQQLFLFMNWPTTAVVKQFPLNIILVVISALGSYYLIERPSLRLRLRLEQKFFSSKKRNIPVSAKLEEGEGRSEENLSRVT